MKIIINLLFLVLTNPKTLLFSLALIRGTLISVSSTSWYGTWIGLEINLLSFIPLISKTNNQRIAEAALKYFIVQVIASSLFLFAVITLNVSSIQLSITIWILAISIKLGGAPFHIWIPEVIEGITWFDCLILITWQKLAPLTLIRYTITSPVALISLIIIISVIVGSVGGLNQTSLRKIIAFSSINHTGWLIAAIICDSKTWITYFLIYSLLTIITTSLIGRNKLNHINQTFSLNMQSTTKLAIFTRLLSLGGLPPFLGFLPKWIVITKITHIFSVVTITIMVLMALITLFYYIRIAYAAFLINHANYAWIEGLWLNTKENYLTILIIAITLLGLITVPLIIDIL